MKYFLSMLAVLALVGGGCVAPAKTDVVDTAAEADAEVVVQVDSEGEEEVVPEQEPVEATNDQAATTEPEAEETTINLQGGGELTFTQTADPQQAEGSEEVEDDGVQITEVVLGGSADVNLNMVSGNFFFEPSIVNAAPGESIKITFTENSGFHTFVIDELQLSFSIAAGEALKFTAPTEPGSYTFYCDIGSHRAFGMEGTLIVQ
ncbi:MAG: cupredoxin domain-containing protein [Parcubacteria group bacterium]|nr:cupredoxin domain-containing protein [Parcubacteria group bacterium]